MFERLKAFCSNHTPIATGIAFYLLAMIGDVGSTIWSTSQHLPYLYESNPFARNLNLQFMWQKAIVLDSLLFTIFALTSYVLYKAVSNFNVKLAESATACIWIWEGYDRLYPTVFRNILFALHFFVPDPIELNKMSQMASHLVKGS